MVVSSAIFFSLLGIEELVEEEELLNEVCLGLHIPNPLARPPENLRRQHLLLNLLTVLNSFVLIQQLVMVILFFL